MRQEWAASMILRVASVMVPWHLRAEWLAEWLSELWYVPRDHATRFCLGAFRDALSLRTEPPTKKKGLRLRLTSPIRCITCLSAIAVLSLAAALRVPGPRPGGPWPSQLRAQDLPAGCIAMLLFTCLMLPAVRLVLGHTPTEYRLPRRIRVRNGLFLALKVALIQPMMLAGFVAVLWMAPVVPVAPQLGMFAAWTLAFRWVLIDQRDRCPMCLRLLTKPVRIGSASQTFLDWYGAESICARGHGFLQSPEIAASYSGARQWLDLDDSWRTLFVETASGRR